MLNRPAIESGQGGWLAAEKGLGVGCDRVLTCQDLGAHFNPQLLVVRVHRDHQKED